MSGQKERVGEAIGMQNLNASGKRATVEAEDDDDEI